MSPITKARRHDRVTPLRYPGGKGKLTPFIRELINKNGLNDLYSEPYAGGAAVALNLLISGDVKKIAINDLSKSIYSFWHSVLNEPEALCKLIRDTPVDPGCWDNQKKIFMAGDWSDRLALGFAMFFLNRTNRSGILNGGMIGGRDQSGPWKIDARYNAADLIERVQSIASKASSISLTNLDAVEFLDQGRKSWPRNTLVYLDPPYYVKGRELYYHFYDHDDHEAVADAVVALGDIKWVVSYDNVREIREIYSGYNRSIYSIGYSARTARQGSEVMFFADDLVPPPMVGPVTVVEHFNAAAL